MHNTLVEKAKMHSCVVLYLTHKVYVNYKRSAQDTSFSGTVLTRAPVAVSATFTLVVGGTLRISTNQDSKDFPE